MLSRPFVINYLIENIDYNKSGMTERCGFSPFRETIIMIVSKVFYYFYMLVLPVMLGVKLWLVVLGFVLLHVVSGLLITFVFQLAHLVEGPEHTDIPHDGKMNNTWAIHQLRSTANFADFILPQELILGAILYCTSLTLGLSTSRKSNN